MARPSTAERPSSALRMALVPLALAQFICSFADSNMNVMINDISKDLDTTVPGVQIAITVFLLVMAALMIPGGRLTDRYGRKRCFSVGLVVYGIGALLSAAAPGLGVLIIGNSILEGVGTVLLIPPVYILATLLFTEITSRARAFGAISDPARTRQARYREQPEEPVNLFNANDSHAHPACHLGPAGEAECQSFMSAATVK